MSLVVCKKSACNRAVTCHKEVLSTQQDTQYNIYYSPDVVTRLMGVEQLPSELKLGQYQLMGETKTAVKFVCGEPGVEESRSETASLTFAGTLGPENGAAFFQEKQQSLFNQRYAWERKNAESSVKHVPALKDYVRAAVQDGGAKNEGAAVRDSDSQNVLAPVEAGSDMITAADARTLARNLSECSDPEVDIMGFIVFHRQEGSESQRRAGCEETPLFQSWLRAGLQRDGSRESDC